MTKQRAGYWRSLAYLLCFAAATLSATALTLYFADFFRQQNNDPKNLIKPRDFALAPFDLTDAIGVCEKKSRNKIGEQLVRTHPDWHSSRYEAKRREYLVTMQADVGTIYVYDKAYIYCHVDPADYVVTYFKVLGLKQKSVFSNKSLKELFKAF